MKKKVIILYLILVFSSIFIGLLYFKNEALKYCDPNSYIYKDLITNIDTNKNKYTFQEKDLINRSSEGGFQKTYKDENSNTMLVEQVFFGESGKLEVKYYLLNNFVLVILKDNYEYLQPIYINSSGDIKSVIKKEFYFNKSKSLCRYRENGLDKNIDNELLDMVQYLIDNI